MSFFLCRYVVNFPRDHKYVSVLKTEDKERVEVMRELVKKRLAENGVYSSIFVFDSEIMPKLPRSKQEPEGCKTISKFCSLLLT